MLDKIKQHVMGALLVASLALGGWMFYENTQLDKKVSELSGEKTALEVANGLLIDSNKTLKDALDLAKNSSAITDDVTNRIAEQTQEFNKQFDGLRKITQKKLSDIEEAYAKKEDTPENREAMRVDISMERARGIWRMYCIAEPDAVECTK